MPLISTTLLVPSTFQAILMDYKQDRQKRQESRLKARSATWEPSGRPCTLQFVFDDVSSQKQSMPTQQFSMNKGPSNKSKQSAPPPPPFKHSTPGGAAAEVEHLTPASPSTTVSRVPSGNGKTVKGGKDGFQQVMEDHRSARPLKKDVDSELLRATKRKMPSQDRKKRNNQVENVEREEKMSRTNSHIQPVGVKASGGRRQLAPREATEVTDSS